MPFEPKFPNARGEPTAYGFKDDLGVSRDGKLARIVFVEKDMKTELPLNLGADLLGKILPSLVLIDAECERRRHGVNKRQVYLIKSGSVSEVTDNANVTGVSFEFIAPSGHHFAFEMDTVGAKLVSESLATILSKIESQTGTIARPKTH
jgi:hypothetical protein